MAEQIISASGPQNPLIVNPDGSINTAISGNIVIGSVTANVDSIYIQSGDNINLNSMGSAWTGTGSVLLTNGASAGSLAYQNVVISGEPSVIGSVAVTNPEAVGSLATQDIVGSVAITTPIVIGSVTANVDAVYIQSGDNLNLGTAFTGVGSVLVDNFPATQNIVGSVVVENEVQVLGSQVVTNEVQVLGSQVITNTVDIVGSVALSEPIVIGSVTANVDAVYIQSGDNLNLGTAFTGVGSVLVDNFPATQNIVGSVVVENEVQVLGSQVITNIVDTIGSVAVTSQEAWSNVGSVYNVNAGSVAYQNVVVSGTPSMVGSVAVTNDVDVNLNALTGAVLSQEVSLTTADTPYLLPASALANRKSLMIYNNSDTDVYVGGSPIATSDGMPIPTGKSIYLSVDADDGVWAVCGTNTKTVRIMEVS
jgi:hypothetical protein